LNQTLNINMLLRTLRRPIGKLMYLNFAINKSG
jgi:hypothetical protein